MSRMSELAYDVERFGMGHNMPPEPTVIERAEDAMLALSSFLNNVPVIAEGEHLVNAKRLVENSRGIMAEMEAERDELVRPLNEQVAGINAKYKSIHNADSKKPGTFDRVLGELKARLTAYAVAEEAKREAAAAEARIVAEQAEAAAREAERLEQQAKMDASVGVIDTGVADAIAQADEAFSEYEHASRFAARAEKATTFRIGDGRGKSLGMRTEKTLHLESYSKAIKAIGPNDKIRDAVLSAARDYKKLHGKLPDGVTETSERKF
jgi:hypothetical protein